jgi:hypothetical protein
MWWFSVVAAAQVVNGDFDAGQTGWTDNGRCATWSIEPSGGAPSHSEPHAYLEGAGCEIVSDAFVIDRVTLSWYAKESEYRWSIEDPAGAELDAGDVSPPASWSPERLDVSAWCGSTVQLRFHETTDHTF